MESQPRRTIMKIATLVFLIRNRSVLLAFKRGGAEIGEGKLNAPGGKLEGDETISECAARETLEEVGVRVDPVDLEEVAVIAFYAAGIPDFEVHVLRTETFSGEPQGTPSMRDPYWYPVDSLEELKDEMHSSDLRWMPQAVRGKRKFRANVFYEKRGEGFLKIEFLPY